jgi:hypothetical protein
VQNLWIARGLNSGRAETVQEAQRFYNVTAAGNFRVALQDIVLGGHYLIPKVCDVLLPVEIPCDASNHSPLYPHLVSLS